MSLVLQTHSLTGDPTSRNS